MSEKLTWNGIDILVDPNLEEGEWRMVSQSDHLDALRYLVAMPTITIQPFSPDWQTICPNCMATEGEAHTPSCVRLQGRQPGPEQGLAEFDYAINQPRRCECGSEKTYGPGAPHSTWCGAYRVP